MAVDAAMADRYLMNGRSARGALYSLGLAHAVARVERRVTDVDNLRFGGGCAQTIQSAYSSADVCCSSIFSYGRAFTILRYAPGIHYEIDIKLQNFLSTRRRGIGTARTASHRSLTCSCSSQSRSLPFRLCNNSVSS